MDPDSCRLVAVRKMQKSIPNEGKTEKKKMCPAPDSNLANVPISKKKKKKKKQTVCACVGLCVHACVRACMCMCKCERVRAWVCEWMSFRYYPKWCTLFFGSCDREENSQSPPDSMIRKWSRLGAWWLASSRLLPTRTKIVLAARDAMRFPAIQLTSRAAVLKSHEHLSQSIA